MEKTKFNQKEKFAMVKDFIQGKEVEMTIDEIVEFLDGRIAQASKKSASKPKGPSEENVKLCEKVAAWMKDTDVDVTIAEVVKNIEGINSPQKATAIMKMLETAGTVMVDAESDKKARHFVLA